MKTITDVYNVFTYDELGIISKNRVINDTINGWIECPELVPNDAIDLYNKAIKKSEQMLTPWFLGECIWELCERFVLEEVKQHYYLPSGKWNRPID
jgi:hypothetical protein